MRDIRRWSETYISQQGLPNWSLEIGYFRRENLTSLLAGWKPLLTISPARARTHDPCSPRFHSNQRVPYLLMRPLGCVICTCIALNLGLCNYKKKIMKPLGLVHDVSMHTSKLTTTLYHWVNNYPFLILKVFYCMYDFINDVSMQVL